ncbi:recombination regulator RecX [Uruburuella testudinis]|uniref:Regulatory protein RecX n=1 Tax=Uruburuella testudinis TaxID=1282863 RepID=A0ABY4DUX8_9NEIS|nr:recombination regulator RecX [Uruburuella testudinis]UOO82417.1 recombination regulator RecX [Uruburuella testudinis]
MKPEKSLRARAMDILSRREISRAELKRKLAPYAESEEEIESVLNEFAERHWQSDTRYAEAYIHSKSRQHGKLRLKQALAAKGVSEEITRALMPDRDTEQAAAIAVLRKKFKQPAADLQEKQKQARFLAYRGFDMDVIHSALKTAWDETAAD